MIKPGAIANNSRVFVISAPSGTGKTTLCNKLLEDKLGLAGSISVTTRLPRPGEVRGVDYHFVTKKRFLNMVKKDEFLEYEENFGNLYGTPKKFIQDNLKKGKNVLVSIDVKGAMKMRKVFGRNAVLIFLMPPSLKALKERLKNRRSDSPKEIKRRFTFAEKEISFKNRYDYLIVNDKLKESYRALKKIIIKELKGE